jgi:phosphoglycolate phosphatase
LNAKDIIWQRQTCVFDLDGTLIDTLPDLSFSLNRALGIFNLRGVDSDVVRRSLHGGLEASVDAALSALGQSLSHRDEVIALYRHHYNQSLAERSHVYEGVRKLLESLRERGVHMAVCTNKESAQANRLLQHCALSEFFSAVVGADTCDARKPDPAPLLRAIDLLRGDPSQSLMIGDSRLDLECARAAAVDCLIHTSGYGHEDIDASLRFETYGELLHVEARTTA